MVIIFSTKFDKSTKKVCEWLSYYNTKFYLIDKNTDFIKILSFSNNLEEVVFSVNNVTFNSKDVVAIWYRNGRINLSNYFPQVKDLKHKNSLKESLNYVMSGYSNAILEYFIFCLEKDKIVLGNNNTGEYNKLIALSYAKKVGFNTPKSIVTNNAEELINCKFNKIITKSLSIGFSHSDTNKWVIKEFTSFVNKPKILNNQKFAITYFQEEIVKNAEIRTFYLNGKCYSNCIFSQSNTKTKLDYRKYDIKNMNRIVPCKLPNLIEKKTIKFMELCKLNTGSIDFILNEKNEYVFLEVNPIGQYDYNSFMGNYYLHQKIAKFLINYE